MTNESLITARRLVYEAADKLVMIFANMGDELKRKQELIVRLESELDDAKERIQELEEKLLQLEDLEEESIH